MIICAIKHGLFKFSANKFDFEYGCIGAWSDLLSSRECITPKLDNRSLHMKKIMGSWCWFLGLLNLCPFKSRTARVRGERSFQNDILNVCVSTWVISAHRLFALKRAWISIVCLQALSFYTGLAMASSITTCKAVHLRKIFRSKVVIYLTKNALFELFCCSPGRGQARLQIYFIGKVAEDWHRMGDCSWIGFLLRCRTRKVRAAMARGASWAISSATVLIQLVMKLTGWRASLTSWIGVIVRRLRRYLCLICDVRNPSVALFSRFFHQRFPVCRGKGDLTPIVLIKVVGQASCLFNSFNVVEFVAELPGWFMQIIFVICTGLTVAAEIELIAEIFQRVLYMVCIATPLDIIVLVVWLILCRQQVEGWWWRPFELRCSLRILWCHEDVVAVASEGCCSKPLPLQWWKSRNLGISCRLIFTIKYAGAITTIVTLSWIETRFLGRKALLMLHALCLILLLAQRQVFRIWFASNFY